MLNSEIVLGSYFETQSLKSAEQFARFWLLKKCGFARDHFWSDNRFVYFT